LLAGRSSSSFAAEVGAMKMNQEIDAMKVLGIDPYEALVLPRVTAMVIMTPLVSFIGCMAGLFAGILIIWGTLGYPPSFFIERFYNYVGFVNFFVGMIKAPMFAATVAIIGCHNGMQVKDDVISLGQQVTKSVVQAIFTIIMIDAFVAIMFNGFDFK
jgi:phospholipid/cholesterol/gamma-HCH transport system permease protein